MTTTTPTVTAEQITATVKELQAALDAMPDPRDVPNTYRIQEEDARQRSILANGLQTIRMSSRTLAEVEPLIATLTTWRDHLIAWRHALLDELHAMGPLDRRRYGHELSIRRIDVGLNLQDEAYPASLPLDVLMTAAGYVPADAVARAHGDAWHGTLPYVEARLRELVPLRDDAVTRRDQVLAEHDARQAKRSTG